MSFILELLKQNKLKLIFFLLFSFISSILGVLILVFINNYLLKNVQNIPIFYFIVLLGIFFISSTMVEFGLNIFGQNFIFKMQRRVVKQILDTPLLKIAKIGKAKILASLGSDIRNISFGLLRLPDFLQSSILIFCTSIYLYYLSKPIFILCMIWIMVVFLTNNFLMIKVYQYFRKARENDDALQNNYQNILDGHKELLMNRYRAKLYYEDEFEKNAKLKKKNSTLGNFFNNLSNNWTNVSLLALVGVEFYLALKFQWASVADATTIALSILFLRTPLVSMIGSFPTLLLAKIALDKIAKLELDTYVKNFKKISYINDWERIIFKDIEFTYDGNFSLNPVNIELKKGELVFLIGKNGSGKSTFCMLLTGLFKASKGRIYLDNMLINDDNLDQYKALISTVFSDFHLFTKTLSKEEFASEEKIAFWLKFLELQDKTKIQDHDLSLTQLSTGQKKRLAMFIALLEERDILVLDEWAADQDPVFRRFFYKKLLPLLKNQGKTIFAITHDDTYFDMADRILLANNGNIEELHGDNRNFLAIKEVEKF
ncbi:multidrug ABC transporter permease/ATP-binding protein [Campylobacter hepaticus]|uniref:Multidrug ABC transporter permease/ATP-binding protein n=1 Tax=Campylobacter hepaticus TaxID=1813019 RepID=A0A6A7JS35_9BACT|nr:multidrug ABC transporter permease/ATP-binding protein [Campylobacter hepaticus]AXP09355.1 multidrug ABC transporter permease/ATP-binding protein [Campylobacter hepaticus]MDX2323593.1 multidrug ABC transporter permease/ATP-binding protein [Campylobacter hepaticus]MDX2331435.1 multidrug ABC transporter permease/ATP-binding protein [Campylobacter hepaticus]MDX2332855.1 multidrug ABC transporter permease/ATP-binding protein [Campylobacter hepaticus]MDX2371994.1 multidrug ABC transporter permea